MLRELEDSAFPGFGMPAGELANGNKNDKPRKTAWRETDLRRAITAAKKSGLRFYSVEVAPDGTISIVVGPQTPKAQTFKLHQRTGKSIKH